MNYASHEMLHVLKWIWALHPIANAVAAFRRWRFDSAEYWEQRYREGGNSGSGSCGHLAEFKAQVLNRFVDDHQIHSVIELGCGDGNQLALARYPQYFGLDVSPTAVDLCRKRFAQDQSKRFEHYEGGSPAGRWRAELALSLDVIYHLTEDSVFDEYMKRLFAAGTRFVVIYSDDSDEGFSNAATHIRRRKFTTWIKENAKSWRCVCRVPNPYAEEAAARGAFSCDFWIYAAPDPAPRAEAAAQQ